MDTFLSTVIKQKKRKLHTLISQEWKGMEESHGRIHFGDDTADMELECRQVPFVEFCTGSTYIGQWNAINMWGVGFYDMMTGVKYRGNMRDGEFRGVGQLIWPCGSKMEGHFGNGGKLDSREAYMYADKKWYYHPYCQFPDRRFRCEKVLTGRRTFLTDSLVARTIPDGCYDVGDGFYNPITKCVYNPKNPEEILRIPTKKEHDWIIKHCRKAWDEVAGHRPEYYENWFQATEALYKDTDFDSFYGAFSKEDLLSHYSLLRDSVQHSSDNDRD